jgi:hypothetical protein
MFKNITPEERKAFKEKKEAEFKKIEDQFLSTAKIGVVNFYKLIPMRYKRNWLKAHLGIASKKQAIAAQCANCVGYSDVQSEVATCTAYNCALYFYRSYK